MRVGKTQSILTLWLKTKTRIDVTEAVRQKNGDLLSSTSVLTDSEPFMCYFIYFSKSFQAMGHHPFQSEPEMNRFDPTEQPVVTFVGFR